MRCLNCKKEIDSYAKICPYCGTCQVILRDSSGKAIETQAIRNPNTETRPEDNPDSIAEKTRSEGGRWKIPAVALISMLVFGAFIYQAGKNQHMTASRDPEAVVMTESQTSLVGAKESNKTKETTAENVKVETTEAEAIPEEHSYKIIMGDFTWEEAYEDALSQGGYLVNFETDEEFEKVKQILHLNDGTKSKLKLWIGGRRSEDTYDYHWVDAEYSYGSDILNDSGYWMKSEPSFHDEAMNLDEYYMDTFFYKKENRWVWNDAPNDIIEAVPGYAGTVGYICEFGK